MPDWLLRASNQIRKEKSQSLSVSSLLVQTVYEKRSVCGCVLDRKKEREEKFYAVEDWGHAAPESQMN